jgi:hypothetical protein
MSVVTKDVSELEPDLAPAGADSVMTVPAGGYAPRLVPLTVLAPTLGQYSGVANAKSPAIGAVGNGVADDSAALNGLMTTIDATYGQGYIPEGAYLLTSAALIMQAGSAVVRGAGMGRTILRAGSALSGLVIGNTASRRQDLTFEDICFDGNSLATTLVSVNGAFNVGVTFRRCRFINPVSLLLAFVGASNVVCEDCLFDGLGTGDFTGISVLSGGRNLTIRRCTFRYLLNGVLVDSGVAATIDEDAVDLLTVEDSYFEGGWYTLPVLGSFANSGGTVTYSATVLTDTAAAFSGLNITAGTAQQNIRAMPVLRTGTLTATATSAALTDSGASFLAAGAREGQILRSGSKFAIVSGVQSATVLRTEGWSDDTTRVPTDPPASGAAYTLYEVYIGEVTSFTATTITTPYFHDLDGNAVTPAAGTRYEVMRNRGNYSGISTEAAGRRSRIRRNTVLRSWSDSISVYGTRADIHDNYILRGQDVGITYNGSHASITRNRLEHLGAWGIYLGHVGPSSASGDNDVAHNVITGAIPWENRFNTDILGAIHCNNSQRNAIYRNVMDGESKPLSQYGITLTGTCDGTEIGPNITRNLSVAGLRIFGASPTNTKLRGFEGVVSHASGAVGTGTYRGLIGTGTPEAAVVANIGSDYTDSAAGKLYLKTSGTGNVGWTAQA